MMQRTGRIPLVVIAAATCNAFAHPGDNAAPLQFIGYSAPFGFDGTATYGEADITEERFPSSLSPSLTPTLVLASDINGVAILELSLTGEPFRVGTYDPDGGYNDVKVFGTMGLFASLAGSTSDPGIHVVDLENRQQPTRTGIIDSSKGSFDNPSNTWVDGSVLYVVNRDDPTIKVLDITDPNNATFIRNINTDDTIGVADIVVQQGRLFAAGRGGSTGSGLDGATYIYDVTNITTEAPQLLVEFETGTETNSAWPTRDGNRLIVANRLLGGGVSLWNIEDIATPTEIVTVTASTYEIGSYGPSQVTTLGDLGLVSWHQAGAQLLNLARVDAFGDIERVGFYTTTVASPLTGFVGAHFATAEPGTSRFLIVDTVWGLYYVDAVNVVPCPCAVDAIQGVDILDVLTFVGWWLEDLEAADLTEDGVVDIVDLLVFLDCWFDTNGGTCDP